MLFALCLCNTNDTRTVITREVYKTWYSCQKDELMRMGSSSSLEAPRRKLSASSIITRSSSSSKNNSHQTTKQPDHLLHVFESDSSISCTSLSEDSSMLVTGSDDGIINVWSALSTPPELLTSLSGHKVRNKYSSLFFAYSYIIY